MGITASYRELIFISIYETVDIVFRALIGYSNTGYTVLFSYSPPPSE